MKKIIGFACKNDITLSKKDGSVIWFYNKEKQVLCDRNSCHRSGCKPLIVEIKIRKQK